MPKKEQPKNSRRHWIVPNPEDLVRIDHGGIIEGERPRNLLCVTESFHLGAYVEQFDDVRVALEKARKRKTPQALLTVLLLTKKLISFLEQFANNEPELTAQLAAKHWYWPVLVSPNGSIGKSQSQMLKIIRLGSEPEAVLREPDQRLLPTLIKQWAGWLVRIIQCVRDGFAPERNAFEDLDHLRPNTPQRFADKRIYNAGLNVAQYCYSGSEIFLTVDLIDSCKKLPRFSPEPGTLKKWWNIARKILLLNSNGKPEAIPSLAEIGKSRSNHYSAMRSAKKKTFSEFLDTDTEMNPESVASNVRAKIYTDVFEEFGRIARQVTKQRRKKKP